MMPLSYHPDPTTCADARSWETHDRFVKNLFKVVESRLFQATRPGRYYALTGDQPKMTSFRSKSIHSNILLSCFVGESKTEGLKMQKHPIDRYSVHHTALLHRLHLQ